ncbi:MULTISPECIES: hypothetical protein [Burkholderia]|uniref:Apea-like HEPN domain-containing protein n=1 Tax=Burkholderia pyrrocinia TaxID=60550 RepID=A0A318IWH7_BURPY|nr:MULTISPECIES: hypothetical protein [Burkholderia]PXX38267.1 hypothetical protein NA66_1003245 [Burkholderia pyrrocinia]SFW54578.1 hypothetical protein SAMN03159384_02787 [Burkholderia sp. NFACC33-1]SFX55028.1 hypothetical protein SAMN03159408_01572 [Burkholderia sp. NFPP32]
MLQISTGKFFNTTETYDTIHRGVLYSNLHTLLGDCITTPAGNLSPAARWGDIETLVCEVIERQPNVRAVGVILSVGPDAFIHDFAAVSSFSLQRLLTPDHDLAMRLLTAQRPPLGIPKLPKQYVSKMFDMSLPYDVQAGPRLSTFLDDLLKLERKSFSGAMKAIRRYVTATHRLADDLDLAYALLVAAIESLAQEFDDFSPEWDDYDQKKRQPVDRALEGASTDVALAVREAILGAEHVAISRRFREFTLAHLGRDFFRGEAEGRVAPVGKGDLEVALKNAYNVRSGYVHALKSIPRLLASPMALTDLMAVDGMPFLTFEGLARVARTVILEFISRAPTTESEEVAYMDDFPNLLRAPLSPSMWIYNAEGYSVQSAYLYLNGFLEQVEQALLSASPVTDIRGVTEKIEVLLLSLAKPEQRRPLIALHFWFSHFLPKEERHRYRKRMDNFISELDTECPEGFFLYVYGGQLPPWSAESCEAIFDTYIRRRYGGKKLNVGTVLGAAGALTIAELYRLAGDEDSARRLIARAIDEFPGLARLREYEANIGDSVPPIAWWTILLPEPKSSKSSATGSQPNKLIKLNRRLRRPESAIRNVHCRSSPSTKRTR